MKVRDTSRGRMYAVSSEIGCTVINGDMAVDIPAGGQSVILALDKKLIIDGDDNAKFVEVRWGTNAAVGSRPAPSWMGDVVDGLVSIVGADKLDVSYIPTENKLIVHTDRVSDELSEEVTALLASVVPQDVEVVQYNHNMEISWRDINKYAACKNRADIRAVNPDFKNDLTSEGEWVYPLTSLERGDNLFGEYKNENYALKKVGRLVLPNATFTERFFQYCVKLKEVEYFESPEARINGITALCPSLVKASYNFPNATIITYVCQGCNALEEVDMLYPKLTDSYSLFTNTKLNKISAIRQLDRLPTYTSGYHSLVIGIHINHKTDEEVLAAITNAEGKGWKLTVQWNPGGPTYTTPEASTFAMGTPIYAKVIEIELPDGTTERILDWGHYVTDWEARGYEQFRSLESAYEYFGLEMPELETKEELQIEEIENA